MLCSERLISTETGSLMENGGGYLIGDSMREIQTSITEDHNKLKSFGHILMKSDKTHPIGQDILKECRKIHVCTLCSSVLFVNSFCENLIG